MRPAPAPDGQVSNPRTPVSEPALELRNLRVDYRGTGRVLAVEAFRVEAGERVAVIGPSGSGKTTLLRYLNGYVAGSGESRILGARFADGPRPRAARGDRTLRRRIGFVFQAFNLIERASVFDNVLWGRLGRVPTLASLLGRFSAADRDAAMAAIGEVGLAHKATRRADELSGGQQQRVGVARVVAQEAELILGDEPVSNLDPRLADDVLELLVGVAGRHGATLMMSLHQPQLAVRHAERIVGLRDGKIVWDGAAAGFDEAAREAIYGDEAGPLREEAE